MPNNEDKTKPSELEKLNDSYFDLGSAVDDLKVEFKKGDAADKARSSAKLVGKTVFNVGLFAGKLGWEAIKAAPKVLEHVGNEAGKRNVEIKEIHAKFENLQDSELLEFVQSKGIFGKTHTEKNVAFKILRSRGLSAEDINFNSN